MAQITWRNVNAPDFGRAGSLLKDAGNSLQRALGGAKQLTNEAQARNEDQTKRNTDEFLNQLRRDHGTPEALQASIANGAVDSLRSRFSSLDDSRIGPQQLDQLVQEFRSNQTRDNSYLDAQAERKARPLDDTFAQLLSEGNTAEARELLAGSVLNNEPAKQGQVASLERQLKQDNLSASDRARRIARENKTEARQDEQYALNTRDRKIAENSKTLINEELASLRAKLNSGVPYEGALQESLGNLTAKNVDHQLALEGLSKADGLGRLVDNNRRRNFSNAQLTEEERQLRENSSNRTVNNDLDTLVEDSFLSYKNEGNPSAASEYLEAIELRAIENGASVDQARGARNKLDSLLAGGEAVSQTQAGRQAKQASLVRQLGSRSSIVEELNDPRPASTKVVEIFDELGTSFSESVGAQGTRQAQDFANKALSTGIRVGSKDYVLSKSMIKSVLQRMDNSYSLAGITTLIDSNPTDIAKQMIKDGIWDEEFKLAEDVTGSDELSRALGR